MWPTVVVVTLCLLLDDWTVGATEVWTQPFIMGMLHSHKCMPVAANDLMEEWFTHLNDTAQYNMLSAQALDVLGFRLRSHHSLCHSLHHSLKRVIYALNYLAAQTGTTAPQQESRGWTASVKHMEKQKETLMARCEAQIDVPVRSVTHAELVKCLNRVRKNAMRAFVVDKFE